MNELLDDGDKYWYDSYIALKVEKKAGEKVDYNKMKVKQLKAILGKTFAGQKSPLCCLTCCQFLFYL